jgi:integrase/recombinase XerD
VGYSKEWLTEEEWRDFKDALDKRDYREKPEQKKWRDELAIKLMYKGGLRVSEMLDLQYPYNFLIEDGRGYVNLDPNEETRKTEREVQPIGKELVVNVRRYMNNYHDEKETNFVFEITRFRVYDIMNELAKIAGIDKKLGTHTLRRSRAKHLIESGQMDLKSVSEFLRHDSIATTEEYLKFSKGKMAKHLDQIDKKNNL